MIDLFAIDIPAPSSPADIQARLAYWEDQTKTLRMFWVRSIFRSKSVTRAPSLNPPAFVCALRRRSCCLYSKWPTASSGESNMLV